MSIGGMVKISLLLAILVLEYELPVKAVEYYFEKLIEPWLFSIKEHTHDFPALFFILFYFFFTFLL